METFWKQRWRRQSHLYWKHQKSFSERPIFFARIRKSPEMAAPTIPPTLWADATWTFCQFPKYKSISKVWSTCDVTWMFATLYCISKVWSILYHRCFTGCEWCFKISLSISKFHLVARKWKTGSGYLSLFFAAGTAKTQMSMKKSTWGRRVTFCSET